MKQQLAKIIGFVTLILLIGVELIGVLRFRYADGIQSMESFHREKASTIDVIFIGSSHMFCNINPKTLWEDFGIASYDLGGSVQPLWNSYFFMKEALKSQHPKVFVLDVLNANFTSEYIDHSRICKNTFGLSFSEDRINAVKASAPPSKWISYGLSYPNYHQRYNDLSKKDFYPQFVTKNCQNDKALLSSKGHYHYSYTRSFPTPKVQTPIKPTPLPEKSNVYLMKIIELCKEHQIPLLLIKTPFAGYSAAHETYCVEVERIAKENNIPFVNFNHFYKEIGMDFTQDAADSSHLNHRGSAKFSRYLGKYLKTHYNLPDHRGEADYASYDTMCQVLQWKIDAQELVDAKKLPAFLDRLQKNIDRYVVVASLQGNYHAIRKDAALCKKLRVLGIPIEEANQNDVWVIDGDHELFHAGKQNDVDWHYMLHDGFVYIRRPASNKAIECNISRENEQLIPNGLNIIIYDKEMEYVIERAGFSTEKEQLHEKQALKHQPK